jgi:hypothetical protein
MSLKVKNFIQLQFKVCKLKLQFQYMHDTL